MLRWQGDLIGAELLYRRALEARERVLGPDHPGTLGSLNNLATLLIDRENFAEALAPMERAWAGFTAHLGPQHTKTAQSAEGLDIIRHRLGRA